MAYDEDRERITVLERQLVEAVSAMKHALSTTASLEGFVEGVIEGLSKNLGIDIGPAPHGAVEGLKEALTQIEAIEKGEW